MWTTQNASLYLTTQFHGVQWSGSHLHIDDHQSGKYGTYHTICSSYSHTGHTGSVLRNRCEMISLFTTFNSLTIADFGCIFENFIFNLASLNSIFRLSYENAVRWMPGDLTDDESTLVQVISWCCQTTSHHLKPVLTNFNVSIWHR